MKLSKEETSALSDAIDCYTSDANCRASEFCDWFKLKMYLGILPDEDCRRLRSLFADAQANAAQSAFAKQFARAVEILQNTSKPD